MPLGDQKETDGFIPNKNILTVLNLPSMYPIGIIDWIVCANNEQNLKVNG